MITDDEFRYYKQLDERMQRLFLGMKAKQLGRSGDTKKKEMLGNFCRPGTCYSQDMRRVNDHDFASSSDGQVVPQF